MGSPTRYAIHPCFDWNQRNQLRTKPWLWPVVSTLGSIPLLSSPDPGCGFCLRLRLLQPNPPVNPPLHQPDAWIVHAINHPPPVASFVPSLLSPLPCPSLLLLPFLSPFSASARPVLLPFVCANSSTSWSETGLLTITPFLHTIYCRYRFSESWTPKKSQDSRAHSLTFAHLTGNNKHLEQG